MNQNETIFIEENAFELVVCHKSAILSRGHWVNPSVIQTVSTQGGGDGNHKVIR